MTRRVLSAALVAAFLVGAAQANASTTLGGTSPSSLSCVPNDAAQTAVGSGADYTVPFDGILTSWSYYNVDGTPPTARLHLKVWRQVSGTTYEVVASPDDQPLGPGLNTWGIRIGVQRGDVLGYHADDLSPCFFVTGDSGDSFNWTLDSSDPQAGATVDLPINTGGSTRLNVSAVLEPDADGDGYGDDTQDACPNDPRGHDAATCNQPPDVSEISGLQSVSEGDTGSYAVSASDPDGDPLTYDWSVTSGAGSISGPADGPGVSVAFPDGPSTVGLQVDVSDDHGHTVTRTLSVDESNVAPALSDLSLTGAAATACPDGNDVALGFTFGDPAGANDSYTGTIDWGDGSASSFASSPVSASHHYAPGTYGVTVNVADEDGGAAAAKTAPVALRFAMSGILQPVNADGSSVFGRRRGSTVPVKVRITDCAGAAVAGLAPQIGVSQDSSLGESDSVNEVGSTSAADSTGFMRYDGGQYIYNLSTTALSTGSWTVYVRQPLAGQSQATFGLR